MMDAEASLAQTVAQYELAQRNRIASGAFLQRCSSPEAAAAVASLHHQERRAEQHLSRAMAKCVVQHPAWPWLERVKGVGPTLSARLLARLRIDKAPTPSSFWQYCGLATVPGERFICAACGAVLTIAAGRTPPGRHHQRNGRPCAAPLVRDTSDCIRVAVRYAVRGQRRPFDASARTLCHIIGTSFLMRGTRYRRIYDARRAALRARHAEWSAMHQHLAAMRVMEKLFLAHLWSVWRQALGASDLPPYEIAKRGPAAVVISPWEMVGD